VVRHHACVLASFAVSTVRPFARTRRTFHLFTLLLRLGSGFLCAISNRFSRARLPRTTAVSGAHSATASSAFSLPGFLYLILGLPLHHTTLRCVAVLPRIVHRYRFTFSFSGLFYCSTYASFSHMIFWWIACRMPFVPARLRSSSGPATFLGGYRFLLSFHLWNAGYISVSTSRAAFADSLSRSSPALLLDSPALVLRGDHARCLPFRNVRYGTSSTTAFPPTFVVLRLLNMPRFAYPPYAAGRFCSAVVCISAPLLCAPTPWFTCVTWFSLYSWRVHGTDRFFLAPAFLFRLGFLCCGSPCISRPFMRLYAAAGFLCYYARLISCGSILRASTLRSFLTAHRRYAGFFTCRITQVPSYGLVSHAHYRCVAQHVGTRSFLGADLHSSGFLRSHAGHNVPPPPLRSGPLVINNNNIAATHCHHTYHGFVYSLALSATVLNSRCAHVFAPAHKLISLRSWFLLPWMPRSPGLCMVGAYTVLHFRSRNVRFVTQP